MYTKRGREKERWERNIASPNSKAYAFQNYVAMHT